MIPVTLLAVLAAVLGDIYLSMAVRGGGWHYLLLAVALLLTHFLLWLAVLSWADLSLAFPLKASYFIFNAMLVGVMLHEPVSPTRWLGTLVVTFGVVLVSLSAATSPGRSSPESEP